MGGYIYRFVLAICACFKCVIDLQHAHIANAIVPTELKNLIASVGLLDFVVKLVRISTKLKSLLDQKRVY